MDIRPLNALNNNMRWLFAFVFILSAQNLQAQLQANFTADKQGGCAPLGVKFTNTTTGASATATWSWNLGNGNTSALKDPGATYFTEKTFTVTLTVKDGANTSTKTLDITVYKKPTVDFSVSKAKGCAPLPVDFKAAATAGDGTIANYLWDFGDGETVQGANYATTPHTYTFPQNPPVTLNVTNSYGCYTTLTKNNIVEVVQGVKANFTPSSLTLCNAGEAITFTNTSTGSGTLTYKWDFGDGKTSTETSPVHTYSTKGTYTATLVASSSDGCSDTKTSATISVANFTADFSFPDKICNGQYFTFTNKSTPGYDKSEWIVDNSPYSYINYYGGNYSETFYSAGTRSIKLIVYYGNCSVSVTKQITVNDVPKLHGFISDLQGACGVPVTVKYSDTTKDAVSWNWQNSYFGNTFATTKNASYNYTSGGYEYVYLTVTNAAGCSASAGKYVNYDKPNIYIRLTGSQTNDGCTGLTLGFAPMPDTAITDYKWNFGDGSAISTDRNPTHTFNKAGSYSVVLDFTTNNGCKGQAFYSYVRVVDKPNFDFTSKSGTTICGNTPDTIVATPVASGWDYYWSFNGDYAYYGYGNSTIIKQFDYDTTYSVTMIAVNGTCRDTVTKEKYIKVLPPFPKIGQYFNTCIGTRGDVLFTENSIKALKWSWDFGDGGTDTYTSVKDTIKHTYTKTGTYKTVLSTTNGGCTVRDSVTVYVLLKQKPVLSSTKTDACGNDVLPFKLSNFEINPHPGYYYYNDFSISKIEYGDFSTSSAQTNLYYTNWQKEVSSTIEKLDPGKNDIRIITTSGYFNCMDTTNFIPVKIHGPYAGYKKEPHSGCFKDPVLFTDTSKQFGNAAIVKWEWDFGDSKRQTLSSGGTVSHLYSNPGSYNVSLKVTDADGCSNTTSFYGMYINVGGPKADFTASAYNVPPNTTVYFYNNSQYYYYYDNTLKWIFSDGTTSTNSYPSFTYTDNDEGEHVVQLITQNLVTGCTDTVKKTITVRKVNSAFTYTLSYINNNSCPPVIATFKSISSNADRVSWDFGDGGVAGNQATASHTYNKPGMYRVVHYSYDSNNQVDSTEDFIEVKGPYALLHADTLYGCSVLDVKLTAEVKYASEYTWDFGDGTVVPTTDTFANHSYLTPGIYTPALILKDAGGCSATSELPDKIIFDSLSVSFTPNPSVICDAAVSTFVPAVFSLSKEQLQSSLTYTWIINEDNNTVTDNNENAAYTFTKTGIHPVSLTVTSPYGCYKSTDKTVDVKPSVHAVVTGPAKLCQGDTAQFAGTALPANTTLEWKWDFANGNTSASTQPLPQVYNAQGNKQITLIVSSGFCSDTAYHSLAVNPHPVINFTPVTPFVCKGSNTNLTATGGIIYKWQAGAGIVNTNVPAVTVQPVTGSFYFVKVTDAEGCSSMDSVFVKVIERQNVLLASSLFACEGSPVKLNASGADKYKWINYTEGLSNTNIAEPVVLPKTSVTYTVVGYDDYDCFSDTANVYVRISKLPLVNAGADKEIISGMQVKLDAVVSGAANWLWSPTQYLDCTDCLNPVSTPKTSVLYTLTAYNTDGCAAKDEVSIKMICKDNLIYIPSAFSPNSDGRNEKFVITGSGVKAIRRIAIYNRWGKIIFENRNVNINDNAAGWDGTYKGNPVDAGTYVYYIQTECEAGDIFNYRGTVTLVR